MVLQTTYLISGLCGNTHDMGLYCSRRSQMGTWRIRIAIPYTGFTYSCCKSNITHGAYSAHKIGITNSPCSSSIKDAMTHMQHPLWGCNCSIQKLNITMLNKKLNITISKVLTQIFFRSISSRAGIHSIAQREPESASWVPTKKS